MSCRDCVTDLLIECSYPVWVCGWFVRYASCVFGLLRYVDVWLAEVSKVLVGGFSSSYSSKSFSIEIVTSISYMR